MKIFRPRKRQTNLSSSKLKLSRNPKVPASFKSLLPWRKPSRRQLKRPTSKESIWRKNLDLSKLPPPLFNNLKL